MISSTGGFPGQGFSPHTVDINGAGNIVVIGDRTFDGNNGRAVVFALISGIWTTDRPVDPLANQFWVQHARLVSTSGSGGQEQAFSLDTSADGNTVAIGAPLDNNFVGATWIFV